MEEDKPKMNNVVMRLRMKVWPLTFSLRMSSKAASSSPAFLSPLRIGNQARRGEAAREGWHTQRPMNSSAPWTFKIHEQKRDLTFPLYGMSLKLHCSLVTNTHVCVRIVKLHHDVRRSRHRDLGVTKNLHLIEDECLVPGGVESVTHCHGFLGLMEERHDGVGVWTERRWR